MKPRAAFCFLLTSLLAGGALSAAAPSPDPVSPWPELTRENKPWIRWWWPGSAVDDNGITQHLERFAAVGLGGVEVTVIYGAKPSEHPANLDFLSPEWMARLQHTGREARRLGLGVDLATGTGWPFGGPWITPADGSSTVVLQDDHLGGTPTHMQVKRAGPGGEGLVVDPFSTSAVDHFLAPIRNAFEKFPRDLLRSQFHDSFEYYDASWTPALPQTFRKMHGYDVQDFARDVLDENAVGDAARVRSDYRETLAALHLAYLQAWAHWSHDRGWLARNQSHGAPANLLDLYGAVDIPETEIFGSTPFPIPGLRRTADEIRHDLDLPEPLVMRMASSAAHVTGHPLASSETCTWLREHWKETLSDMKPEIDRLFVNGINHVVFHGSCYSPASAPWPGWYFYASTEFNDRNPWWNDFGALNAYVGRVQSLLQRGRPDNPVLVYWPVFDLWDEPGPIIHQLGVHNSKWITAQPVGALAHALLAAGYSLDFVSDAQLESARADDHAIALPGGRYRVLVVPPTRRMPDTTLAHLARLARDGATVIFARLPEDVPGRGELEARRARFHTALAALDGHATVRADVVATLARDSSLEGESIGQSGLEFIRRVTAAGHDYFIANLTGEKFDGWLPLAAPLQSANLLDPLTGTAGRAALRTTPGHAAEIYLQLPAGASILVQTFSAAAAPRLPGWPYRQTDGEAVALTGDWSIEFLPGHGGQPSSLHTTQLKSWTEIGGPLAEKFSGTARYHLEFELPAVRADDWLLDLGDVRESARIRVNGHDAGTAWSLPFERRIGEFLHAGKNTLDLEVTNLAANAIRDLDRNASGNWRKIMGEINLVNINYKPFDASHWDIMPSGLLGPVRLVPLRKLKP